VFIGVSGVVVDGAKLPSSAGDFIDDAAGAGSECRPSAAAGMHACRRPAAGASQGIAPTET